MAEAAAKAAAKATKKEGKDIDAVLKDTVERTLSDRQKKSVKLYLEKFNDPKTVKNEAEKAAKEAEKAAKNAAKARQMVDAEVEDWMRKRY